MRADHPLLAFTLCALLPAPGIGQTATTTAVSPAGTPSQNQTMVNRYAPGNVILTFEGGVPGLAIASVLRVAADQGILKTHPYVIQKGDSVCEILARDFPPPCDDLLKLMQKLNPALVGRRGFQIGDTVQIPDVSFRRFRKARGYLDVKPTENARKESVLKNWGNSFNAKVLRQSDRATYVDFEAYDLIIVTPDPAAQKKFLAALPSQPNVAVSPIGWSRKAANVFGTALDGQRDACQAGSGDVHVNYLDYATTDADLLERVLTPPPGAVPPTVHIIDVKLEVTPNLADAIVGHPPVIGPSPWKCVFSGDIKPINHATHLASIIASRDNGYGFVGIAPNARIESSELLEADATGKLEIGPEKAQWLADEINNNVYIPTPSQRIYLLAAELENYPAEVLDRFGQIKTPEERFRSRPVEKAIYDQRPLFIVAAGQESGNNNGLELTDRAPRSPQNLGDLRNVIVVSACQDCTRRSPSLMASANYSGADRRFVQVAAPGGSPMLGWLGPSGVGMGAGTSQAGAFAAGVVARMTGYWPDYYPNPDLVKTRLQVTSWPIVARLGSPVDYSTKIATGLVDPTLAWLDPSKHWLKTNSQGWREVKLKTFATRTIGFTDKTEEDTPVATRGMARLVLVSGDDPNRRWVVYRDLFRENRDKYPAGSVARSDPVKVPDAAVLQTCSGPIPMRDVVDLVIAFNGISGSC